MASKHGSATDTDSTPRRPSGRLIAGVVIVALLIVFVAQNTASTHIRFLVPEVETPLWTALAAAVILGLAAGGLIAHHRGR